MENIALTNIEYLRAYREPRRQGKSVLAVEVESGALLAALVRRGIVPPGKPVQRSELEAHAGAILALFSQAKEA